MVPRNISGTGSTPTQEILGALAGYDLRPLIQPEDPDKPPYALPSVFLTDGLLSLTNVGRFYYLCHSADGVRNQKLLSRLDPARTLLLPYEAPSAQSPMAQVFPTVGLTTLKRREQT